MKKNSTSKFITIAEAERHFEKELEVFRTEAETALQFFYANDAIHASARRSAQVHRLLNESALFWGTCAGALQTGVFIVLGRIFDQNSKHNIDRLISIAEQNHGIFSRSALERRKRTSSENADEWIGDFMIGTYEPTPRDFRKIRTKTAKWRSIYHDKYRDIRRKWFAHKEISDTEQVAPLFAKTKITELQQMLTFLTGLYKAMWELYMNGMKPVIRQQKFSTKRILRLRTGNEQSLQGRIVHECKLFLATAAERSAPGTLARRKQDSKKGSQHA